MVSVAGVHRDGRNLKAVALIGQLMVASRPGAAAIQRAKQALALGDGVDDLVVLRMADQRGDVVGETDLSLVLDRLGRLSVLSPRLVLR